MTSIAYISDVAARGVALLPSVLREQPVASGLVRGLLGGAQEMERVFHDTYTGLSDPQLAASGLLDVWGQLLGASRDGLTDRVFRGIIRARLLIDTSNGTVDTLRQVAQLLVDASEPSRAHSIPGQVDIEVITDGTSALEQSRVRDLVTDAAPAGIHVGPITEAPAAAFRLDVGPGLDVGELAASW